MIWSVINKRFPLTKTSKSRPGVTLINIELDMLGPKPRPPLDQAGRRAPDRTSVGESALWCPRPVPRMYAVWKVYVCEYVWPTLPYIYNIYTYLCLIYL